MKNNRMMGQGFLADLQGGILTNILTFIKKDHTLDLQIRGNYINIYYRGGNLLKIEKSNGIYKTFFNKDYYKNNVNNPFNNKNILIVNVLPDSLKSTDDVDQWVEAIPFLKQAMDFFFAEHKKNEREFQQLIVRENNYVNKTTARSSDYYICDIEYQADAGKKDARFDMVAVKWESDPQARKQTSNARLSLIEVKYGDGSMLGNSGIIGHVQDMRNYLANPNNLNKLKKEAIDCFNEKFALGLIDVGKTITAFDTKLLPEYIFVLINHDPAKSALRNIIMDLWNMNPKSFPFELKFAGGNFMGYSLFKESIFSFDDFLCRFSAQIG